MNRTDNFELIPLGDPVLRFISTSESYSAYCQSGLRLDIARCRNILLDQEDPDDYWNFLWMQSLQGFFVVRQRVRVGVTEEWVLVGELFTSAPVSQFFDSFQEHFEHVVRRFGLADRPPVEEEPPLDHLSGEDQAP